MLAAIWGGCAVEGCDRPPSWTEAHHIDEWLRHRGETNVDRGILLCRHHHMLIHARGWRIIRRDNEFLVVGPAGNDEIIPIRLVSKNPIRQRH
jgi:predicted restriction endonuclease